MHMTSKWQALAELGQSVWYDNVARPALASGLLARLVEDDHVTGGTSNPSIFAKAVADSDLYDDDIRDAGDDETPQQVFERLAVAAIQQACDLLRPVWDRTGGQDGYISLEEEAEIAFDADAAVRRGHELRDLVDRPNIMIKVPGTEAGVEAFGRLTREGVSVNVTLLFSRDRYRAVADAYVDAIDGRLAAGEDVSVIASVASFFVSRIDAAVDALLPEASPLRGRAAIANARLAYADVFLPAFTSDRWRRLAAGGANYQRPLWASTGVKDPAYPDTLYIDGLVGAGTVTTVPDATLDAFRTGGTALPTLHAPADEARAVLEEAAAAGVDVDRITADLERDGVAAFADAYDRMLAAIADKRARTAA
jgi:transaldolase/glucose-6-phosphate isomerase